MSMQQREPDSTFQKHKDSLIKRWITFIIEAIIFIAGTVALILSYVRVIPYNLSYVLSSLLGLCGILITLFTWHFPSQPIEARPTSDAKIFEHSPHDNENTPGTIKGQPLPDTINTGQPDEDAVSNRKEAYVNTIQVQPHSIFHFNEILVDPDEFYGRVRECTTLFSRTQRKASTSIIGPRRIGKTWLLTFIKLSAPTRFNGHLQVGYLNVALPKCRTITGFTTKALEELGVTTLIPGHSRLGLDILEQAVGNMIARNQIPVLCIDEFEKLADRPAFDLDFFESLRALTQDGLVLITASKKPLIEIVRESAKGSPFFNVFEQLELKPFTKEEAQNFAKEKSIQAGFTDQEQQRLLEYGREYSKKGEEQWFPLSPQLTGKMLLEDKWLAAKELPSYYRPQDADYWREFEERWNKAYRGVRA